jgi:hypothetical protein
MYNITSIETICFLHGNYVWNSKNGCFGGWTNNRHVGGEFLPTKYHPKSGTCRMFEGTRVIFCGDVTVAAKHYPDIFQDFKSHLKS